MANQSQKDKLRNLFSGDNNGNSENKTATNTTSPNKSMEIMPEITPIASIKVLGLGGGGGNAINRMIKANLKGMDFVASNTDAQALYHNDAATKINIGKATTRGLGAGSNPDLGKQAAEERGL